MDQREAEIPCRNINKHDEILEEMFQAGVLGPDRSKMLERLKRANKIAITVSIIGVALGMTLMLFPEMKFISMVIKSLCLWMCIGMVFINKGLYTFRPRSKDPHPSLFYAIFWPTIVGCWTAFYTIPYYINWLAPVLEIVVLGILINGLMIYLDKGLREQNKFFKNLFCFMGIPYAFVVINYFNVSLDQNPTNSFSVKVLSKTKSFNSNVVLVPWGDTEKGRKIKLDITEWNKIKEGDFVTVELYQGALGNSWFKVNSNIAKN